MNRFEQIILGVWIAISILISFLALNLGVGTLSAPGPGMFPFVSAIFLGGASIIYFAVFCLRRAGDRSLPTKSEEMYWKRPGLVVLFLVIYSLLVVRIGYLVATFFLLMILFNASPGARREWKYTAAGSLATVFISYFVFCKLLQIPLPLGILGF